MRFVWDDVKSDSNVSKHGVTFQRAIQIWQRPSELLVENDERGYDEDRFVATGLLPDGTILIVAHTYRGENIRIISARKAEAKERKRYHEKIYRAKR